MRTELQRYKHQIIHIPMLTNRVSGLKLSSQAMKINAWSNSGCAIISIQKRLDSSYGNRLKKETSNSAQKHTKIDTRSSTALRFGFTSRIH